MNDLCLTQKTILEATVLNADGSNIVAHFLNLAADTNNDGQTTPTEVTTLFTDMNTGGGESLDANEIRPGITAHTATLWIQQIVADGQGDAATASQIGAKLKVGERALAALGIAVLDMKTSKTPLSLTYEDILKASPLDENTDNAPAEFLNAMADMFDSQFDGKATSEQVQYLFDTANGRKASAGNVEVLDQQEQINIIQTSLNAVSQARTMVEQDPSAYPEKLQPLYLMFEQLGQEALKALKPTGKN